MFSLCKNRTPPWTVPMSSAVPRNRLSRNPFTSTRHQIGRDFSSPPVYEQLCIRPARKALVKHSMLRHLRDCNLAMAENPDGIGDR